MVTVTAPVAMKMITATRERKENLDSPQTPWPLVQPEPSRVPNPTRRPPDTIRNHEGVMSNAIVSLANSPYISGPKIRPKTNNNRHNLSPEDEKKEPEKIPLIPAILPLKNINITAASPIRTPPIVAETGVKFSILNP